MSDKLNIPPIPEMKKQTVYVVEKRSWFYGFLQSCAAFLVGSIVVGIFSSLVFLSMMGAMMAMEETPTDVKENSILHISLNATISERAEENPFAELLGNDALVEQGLDQILQAIKAAKGHKDIKGIYLEGGLAQADVASLEEIRAALLDFKTSGKFIYAYADQYTEGGYYIASVADKVMLNPSGLVDWHGLASQPMFYKEVLDKLGINMQVFRVGTYKSAVEPFIATEMSDANRQQVQSYLNSTWTNLKKDVAASRGLSIEKLDQLADEYLLFGGAEKTIEEGLVDTLVYINGAREALREAIGNKAISLVTPKNLNKVTELKKKTFQQGVAVYYAYGEIVDQASTGLGSASAEIVGNKVVKDLDELMNDDEVKAVVLRINSPGGSAYASEQMWNAIELLKQKKPVVVSMGGLAASGGYYISCNANHIFADPTTLTGSIGIFGLIPDFSDLITKKIGIKFDVVKTNQSSDFGAMGRPFNKAESTVMQAYIEKGYALFLKRVADGRKLSVEEVDKIAQGRVWTGEQALEIGLVDSLGTLDNAIAYAASLAGLSEDCQVKTYPEAPNMLQQLMKTVEGNYMERELKGILGEHYNHLKFIKQAGQGCQLQARIPFDLNMQ